MPIKIGNEVCQEDAFVAVVKTLGYTKYDGWFWNIAKFSTTHSLIHACRHSYVQTFIHLQLSHAQKEVMKESIMQRVSATLQGNKTHKDNAIIFVNEMHRKELYYK